MSARPGGAVVVHGGAGAPIADVDGCHAAARAAIAVMRSGGAALDAVVRAVVALEDDGRFNAGSGAVLGMDGATIEMDAGLMDSRGMLGAVACIQRVKNPVLVARAVADSPHRFLCGEGAERFAMAAGLERAPVPSEAVWRRRQAVLSDLAAQLSREPAARQAPIEGLWNYPGKPVRVSDPGCDTVGAVARDAQGHFAVAGSTGGVSPALMGRVGDTPIIGAGFYAGAAGAVAVTGTGEQLIPRLLAHTVYQWIALGMPLKEALERGVALFAAHVDVGLIAVSRTESGYSSNRAMPVSIGAYDHG